MGDEEPRPRRKKKKKRAPVAEAPPPPPVAEGWAPSWLSYVATGVAAFYLLLVYADASGWEWLGNRLPRPLHYFGQVAALFPQADAFATDFYVQGWQCREQRWVELDIRPWFPIDADEKENRFSRAVGFYAKGNHEDMRTVMNALDDFIVPRVNAARMAGESADSTELIGGIRIFRASIPLPKFGDHVERYFRRKLADMPDGYKRRYFYTRSSKRTERCKGFYPEYDPRGLVDNLERGEKRTEETAPVDKSGDAAPRPDESEP